MDPSVVLTGVPLATPAPAIAWGAVGRPLVEIETVALAPARRARREAEPSPAGIVRHLAEHGIPAVPDRLVFKASEIDAAERLLSHLADFAADLRICSSWADGRAAASATA
ncbi:MAG: hypothetical protein ACXW3G_10335 [Rhodoplanes sp.]